MQSEVRVPKWGLTIESAKIIKWLKHEGDPVVLDEVLCEVETEKSVAEIESPVAGVLSSIVAAEGETRKVGEIVCLIDEES